MAKYSYSGRSGSLGSNAGGVSSARLHQRSGSSNAFGGYAKIANNDGTYRMRKSGK